MSQEELKKLINFPSYLYCKTFSHDFTIFACTLITDSVSKRFVPDKCLTIYHDIWGCTEYSWFIYRTTAFESSDYSCGSLLKVPRQENLFSLSGITSLLIDAINYLRGIVDEIY